MMYNGTDDGPVPALEICQQLLQSIPAGGCPAAVHSVFDRAVNLTTPLGLVTLLPSSRPLHPFSVRLGFDGAFPSLGLLPEMDAMLQPGGLTAGSLRADFAGAQATDLSILTRRQMIVPPTLCERLACIAQVIGRQGKPEGVSPLLFHMGDPPPGGFAERFPHNAYTAFLLPRVERLLAALRAGEIGEISAATSAAAGCGPGLTPSSDDFLCGVMAAMLARAAARGRVLHTMDVTQRMGCAARAKTNVISGGLLIRCSKGLLSADLLETLEALFSNGTLQSLESAASKVISFGETSGTDILTGICFGAKI